ncbi:hypothetical protein V8J88_20295 [Massilia sp. W12]|uniref:hypothetical protein n=1 Tax=Massilia sp. W12 TaxID=3126507 RepID=UPI0030D2B0F7
MSSFSRSPRVLRAALALMEPLSGRVQQIIPMQYNPDSLSRTLQAKGVQADSGEHVEALRLKGPPVETIRLEAELDASEGLANGDGQTVALGLHPQLAALEALLHPSSSALLANQALAALGSIEILPMQGALPLFIFGPQRIVPVRIQEFSITEEAFDPALNPIRARVALSLRVLSVDDLGFMQRGGHLFISYLQNKEALARKLTGGSLQALGLTGI